MRAEIHIFDCVTDIELKYFLSMLKIIEGCEFVIKCHSTIECKTRKEKMMYEEFKTK